MLGSWYEISIGFIPGWRCLVLPDLLKNKNELSDKVKQGGGIGILESWGLGGIVTGMIDPCILALVKLNIN